MQARFKSFDPGVATETPVGEIISDIEIKQTFTLPSNVKKLIGFSLIFATWARTNISEITVSLSDAKGHIIQKYNLRAETLADNSFVDFELSQPQLNSGDAFTLLIKSDAVAGNGITLWSSVSDSYDGGILTINGAPTGGDICFRLYYVDRLSQLPALKYFKYVTIILTILVCSVCYFALFAFKRVFIRYAVIIFTVGLMYCVVMTPYSQPDAGGMGHVFFSELLSNDLLMHNEKLSLIGAEFATGIGHKQTSKGYVSLIENFFKIDHSVVRNAPLINISRYRLHLNYPLAYLPQAVGISIARLIWINNTWVYYAGTITNLLFYALVVALAIKIIPESFRNSLIVLALLPMSLHQAASYSYDTFVNALSFLFVAYILKLWEDDTQIRAKQIIILILIVTLLAPAKVCYGILGFCVLIIPHNKFVNRRQFWGVVLIAVILPLAVTAIFKLTYIVYSVSNSFLVKYWDTYTLDYAFQNPLKILKIFIISPITHAKIWKDTFLGGYLSGHTIFVPLCWIDAYTGVLFLSVFSNETNKRGLSAKNRLILFAVSVVIFEAILAAIFFSWTAIGSELVQGVHGRYFIPIALPLLCVCSNRFFHYDKRVYNQILVTCAILLNIIITNYVAQITIATL
jgi:uncharacterized membrane protein